jgi:hypothetical protein
MATCVADTHCTWSGTACVAAASACGVPWTIVAGQAIYDMSGNAKEWTLARSAGVNPLRGGSYFDISNGMSCTFNWEVANDSVRLPEVGFRCCRATDPAGP